MFHAGDKVFPATLGPDGHYSCPSVPPGDYTVTVDTRVLKDLLDPASMMTKMAALTPEELQTLSRQARALGVDVLVEVHDAYELAIAADSGAHVIGVNNRNLRTLAVDVKASETLIARMPKDAVAVSESGLRTADDLIRLHDLGYQAFLVGERFMTTADPGAALRELLAGVACH